MSPVIGSGSPREDLAAGLSLPASLVLSQLSPPAPHPAMVERPRLHRLLDAAVRFPVAVLTAPVGSGKTQLLSAWGGTTPDRVAWLTLSSAEADPMRFWSVVLAALRRVARAPSDAQLFTLQPAPEHEYATSVLPALVVDAVAELENSVVLVLDEIQEIADSQAAESLAYLMAHLPDTVHLVLSGVFLPDALPRARLRVEGRLTTIAPEELACTREEVAQLLGMVDADLPPATVSAIWRHTEGWATGVRLSALALAEGGGSASAAPAELIPSGTVGAETADFLVTEVVRNLPEQVRTFLLATCVCERLTPALADSLTGATDGRATLRWLTERNVFTSRTTETDEWYRYHALFAATLRTMLGGPDTPAAAEQHIRAARWHKGEGLWHEGFAHACAAQDWDLAQDIVLSSWLSLYLDGQMRRLEQILSELDRAPVETGRTLVRVRSLVALVSGTGELSPPEGTGTPALDDLDEDVAGLVLVLERGRMAGNLEVVDAAADAMSALLDRGEVAPRERGDLTALTLYERGVTEYWNGERILAEQHLTAALRAAQDAGRLYLELACTAQLVGVLTAQDRLDDALVVAGKGTALARASGWEQAAAAAELWHALGWIHYLRNDLAAADHYLDLGDDAVRDDDVAIRGVLRLVRSLVLSQRGQKRRALHVLEEAVTVLKPLAGRYVFDAYLNGELARLNLALGRAGITRELLGPHRAPREPLHVALARAELSLAEGRTQDAADLLLASLDDGPGYLDQRIRALTTLALVQEHLGRGRVALDTLSEAVGLAAPERMVQPLLQPGPRLDRLLETLESREGQPTSFIGDLRAQFAVESRPLVSPTGLIEPLTAREREVLDKLDGRSTLPEIAAELFVSVNTVKAHLRSLYPKLGVHGRREAVARAVELGLL